MITPVLKRILPFSASESQVFEFSAAGAPQQVFYNELTVFRASNNEIVYKNKIQDFRYQHTLEGDSTTLELKATDDTFKTYIIPTFVDEEKIFKVFLDGLVTEQEYAIDTVENTLTFTGSLKEDLVDEVLEMENYYKTAQLQHNISLDYPFVLKRSGTAMTEEQYSLNYETGYITFTDPLDKEIEEVLIANESNKYPITNENIISEPHKVTIDDVLVSSLYKYNEEEKAIEFLQHINKEIATADPTNRIFTVVNPIIIDTEIEIKVDNVLQEEGYKINYEAGTITFLLGAIDPEAEVEVSYYTQAVLQETVVVKALYRVFDDIITASYTKPIPTVTFSQNFLNNGEQYYTKVEIFNRSGESMGESEVMFFYCFSRPIVTIPSIQNAEVGASTVTFVGSYFQAEEEMLQSYQFLLYDDNKELITKSDEIFTVNDGINYEISDLKTRTKYFIELKVWSVNDLRETSGLIEFNTIFAAPRFNSVLELDNLEDEASVGVLCNIVRIIGIPDIEPMESEDGKALLLENGITFDKGFRVTENWTIQMVVSEMLQDSIFFKLESRHGESIQLEFKNNKINMYKIMKDGYIMQMLLGKVEINNINSVFIHMQYNEGLYDFEYEEVEI